MKWLEIIEVRSVGFNREFIETHLQKLIDEVENEAGPMTVYGYRHAMIDNNFSIHLNYDSIIADKSGSSLGLRLVSILKDYGLVNHSVWITSCDE